MELVVGQKALVTGDRDVAPEVVERSVPDVGLPVVAGCGVTAPAPRRRPHGPLLGTGRIMDRVVRDPVHER